MAAGLSSTVVGTLAGQVVMQGFIRFHIPLWFRRAITMLPSVKLQIGDRDNYGNYWDGGSWRDRDYWRRHYEWRDNRWHR
ncbi:DUF2502 domain-containing protein, partial [Klebsiella pneumoniae]|nr:DUF2502 domain-containing protein [Klebsiella pneumoniae]